MAQTREVRLGKVGEKRCLSEVDPWEGAGRDFPSVVAELLSILCFSSSINKVKLCEIPRVEILLPVMYRQQIWGILVLLFLFIKSLGFIFTALVLNFGSLEINISLKKKNNQAKS